MNNAITPPKVPDSHVAFAKMVAELAVGHGIDRFEMTFRPKWNCLSTGERPDPRIHGDMKIVFSDSDGRGRPCRNLAINLVTYLALEIESNPTSHA
jgi:hypothetical protein